MIDNQSFLDYSGLIYYDSKSKEYITDLNKLNVKFGGVILRSSLPVPSKENCYYMYKILDKFTTDEFFEDIGKVCIKNTFVICVPITEDEYHYTVLLQTDDFITHETGSSSELVMSQKAVTDEFTLVSEELANVVDKVDKQLDNKLDKLLIPDNNTGSRNNKVIIATPMNQDGTFDDYFRYPSDYAWENPELTEKLGGTKFDKPYYAKRLIAGDGDIGVIMHSNRDEKVEQGLIDAPTENLNDLSTIIYNQYADHDEPYLFYDSYPEKHRQTIAARDTYGTFTAEPGTKPFHTATMSQLFKATEINKKQDVFKLDSKGFPSYHNPHITKTEVYLESAKTSPVNPLPIIHWYTNATITATYLPLNFNVPQELSKKKFSVGIWLYDNDFHPKTTDGTYDFYHSFRVKLLTSSETVGDSGNIVNTQIYNKIMLSDNHFITIDSNLGKWKHITIHCNTDENIPADDITLLLFGSQATLGHVQDTTERIDYTKGLHYSSPVMVEGDLDWYVRYPNKYYNIDNNIELVQETGDSKEFAMSQKAVTDALNKKIDETDVSDIPLENKLPKYTVDGTLVSNDPSNDNDVVNLKYLNSTKINVVDEPGYSKTDAISQAFVTYALEDKIDVAYVSDTPNPSMFPKYTIDSTLKSSAPVSEDDVVNLAYLNEKLKAIPKVNVVQETGDSETDVLSQKAVTEVFDKIFPSLNKIIPIIDGDGQSYIYNIDGNIISVSKGRVRSLAFICGDFKECSITHPTLAQIDYCDNDPFDTLFVNSKVTFITGTTLHVITRESRINSQTFEDEIDPNNYYHDVYDISDMVTTDKLTALQSDLLNYIEEPYKLDYFELNQAGFAKSIINVPSISLTCEKSEETCPFYPRPKGVYRTSQTPSGHPFIMFWIPEELSKLGKSYSIGLWMRNNFSAKNSIRFKLYNANESGTSYGKEIKNFGVNHSTLLTEGQKVGDTLYNYTVDKVIGDWCHLTFKINTKDSTPRLLTIASPAMDPEIGCFEMSMPVMVETENFKWNIEYKNVYKKDFTLTNLSYKKIGWIGDSIMRGIQTLEDQEVEIGWIKRIAEKNSCVYENVAYNGAVMTKTDDNGYLYKDDGSVIVDADGNNKKFSSICNKLTSLKIKNPDVICFDGGANDYFNRVAVGDISTDYETFNEATYCGALESTIKQLIELYPNTKLAYIIPYNMQTYGDMQGIKAYFDKAIKICEKWGVPYCDLRKLSTMNYNLNTSHYTDNVHANASGYEFTVSHVENFLKQLVTI